jgi:hypothetical protein
MLTCHLTTLMHWLAQGCTACSCTDFTNCSVMRTTLFPLHMVLLTICALCMCHFHAITCPSQCPHPMNIDKACSLNAAVVSQACPSQKLLQSIDAETARRMQGVLEGMQALVLIAMLCLHRSLATGSSCQALRKL